MQVLLELLVFLVLPVLVDVFLVKVVLARRYKRGDEPLVREILPGEILEPGMILDLLRTVQSQSVRRLSLDHL